MWRCPQGTCLPAARSPPSGEALTTQSPLSQVTPHRAQGRETTAWGHKRKPRYRKSDRPEEPGLRAGPPQRRPCAPQIPRPPSQQKLWAEPPGPLKTGTSGAGRLAALSQTTWRAHYIWAYPKCTVVANAVPGTGVFPCGKWLLTAATLIRVTPACGVNHSGHWRAGVLCRPALNPGAQRGIL